MPIFKILSALKLIGWENNEQKTAVCQLSGINKVIKFYATETENQKKLFSQSG